jgi:hypothetical protein
MPDLQAWARDVARLLKPSGELFVFEEHPAAALWTWDPDEVRIRPDRSYFARSHVNDSFPGGGATQSQWTIGELVTALGEVGLRIVHLSEHPGPFWRMSGVSADVWSGRLPNSFALLARRS